MSTATEDYLKRIYTIAQGSDEPLVPLGELARRMNVTRGTVTSMMKHLSSAGLVDYVPRAGVALTEAGKSAALVIVRRHRLLELFLVEMLGLDWAHVHEEAEILEHAVSDRVLSRIDDILGHPETDPHGEPIPSQSGRVSPSDDLPLSAVSPPAEVTVRRISNEDSEFLDYVRRNGLSPGALLQVLTSDTAADTILVRSGRNELALGPSAAANIHVSGAEAGAPDPRE